MADLAPKAPTPGHSVCSDHHEMFRLYCKAHNKCGIYLAWNNYTLRFDDQWEECQEALIRDMAEPYSSNDELILQLASARWAVILLDTQCEKALHREYLQFQGDDTGGQIYALSCNAKGELINENT